MRKFRAIAAISSILFLALVGCQQIFTTSLGSPLKRDSVSIPSDLSTTQATDLAQQAKDNQDTALANALVTSLNTQIASTTDPTEKAELEAAAASAAITASGAGSALLTAVDSLQGGAPTSEQISTIVTQIQSGTTNPGVVQALLYLNPASLDPTTVDSSVVSASDYLVAAAIIAATNLPSGVTDPDKMTPAELDAFQKDPEVIIAAQMANAAATLVSKSGGDPTLADKIAGYFKL